MMLRTLLGLACALAVTGCMSNLSPDVGEPIAGQCKSQDSEPDVEVSFKQDILPMLEMGCGCHSPKSQNPFAIDSTGFNVGSFASIRRGGQKSGTQIVVPKDPCASVLYQKCTEAPPSGARMPLYGPFFDKEDMALLHDWIAEGAREN